MERYFQCDSLSQIALCLDKRPGYPNHAPQRYPPTIVMNDNRPPTTGMNNNPAQKQEMSDTQYVRFMAGMRRMLRMWLDDKNLTEVSYLEQA